MQITSLTNEKIKKIIKLRNKNKRDKYNQFLIEGYREILRADESKIKFDSLFICRDFFLGSNEDKLIEDISKNAQIFECTKEVFRKISYRDRPDGLIAIAEKFHYSLKDLPKKKDAFFVICESIEKPGNLGTILRSSDAAGVDAVIVADSKTDIFNPNVVRASIGTLFTQTVIEDTSENILSFLKKNRINILAATPHAKKLYTDVDLKKSLALVVGTEQYGLSEKWMNNSNILVKIPMYGKADSLNVAGATTILLYETIRQRKLS